MKKQSMVQAKVVSITDGDTFKVLLRGEQKTIRIACIDTPEMSDPPWGKRAKDVLSGMLKVGSKVNLVGHDIDRYGRIVAEVYKGRSRNIGLALVKRGYAEVYDKYAYQCDEDELIKFESRAQRHGKGMWKAANKNKVKTDNDDSMNYEELQKERINLKRRLDQLENLEREYQPVPITNSNDNLTSSTGTGRITCSQLSSQAQAREYLNQGHSYLDMDGDGIPCESLPVLY